MLVLEDLDAAAVRAVAAALGAELRAGDVVALAGEIGAGKTFFAGGLGAGLGLPPDARVTSPTFTFLNVHLGGRLPFYHLDLYRLPGEGAAALAALRALGLDEQLPAENGATAVEWLERCPGAAPAAYLRVTLAGAGDAPRRLCVEAVGGEAAAARVAALERRYPRHPGS
ncbi:MAG TPA: tRNA (adenosine(37)-N6)-threonylcarbamoyltransferase complex ATPase subunit type 1 TsaE [Myxococcota bacterium]|nr:tRNA (adenosine(37)-N6)-threonylcarbamoyltransferase complex ATPase subunit type 1 TsaE [Myxococcota bacterium]